MDWLEVLLAVGSLAVSVFVYLRNKNLKGAVEKIEESLKTNKVLYVICPKCGTKIELTLANVKEEDKNQEDTSI